MAATGWKRLLEGVPWFRGPGSYPLAAYSEFMPPPRLGRRPYPQAEREPYPFFEGDPFSWQIAEYEEALELRPGMEHVAGQVVTSLAHLGHGRPAHGIAHGKLHDNPCWPAELADKAGSLPHERYVVLMPLALARTQDDKGRLRWTLFGSSDQGPARPFWLSFFTAPRKERPAEEGLDFLRRLLSAAYGEPTEELADLHRAGLLILPDDGKSSAFGDEGPLPSWTAPLRCGEKSSLRGVRYLLTFRPFAQLPAAVRRAYLAGELHLLPFPGSLLFWHIPAYLKLRGELPLAVQVPLLHLVARHEAPSGLRVPQSGWLHEPLTPSPSPPGGEGEGVRGGAAASDRHGPVRNTFKRTHRWARVLRDQDELALMEREDKLLHVLFSTIPDDLGLYDKPMARNVQLWTDDFRLLLDGPNASPEDIRRALQRMEKGGLFGYRFLYPAMRVGKYEVFWHRPLVAYLSAATGQPTLLPDAPAGYLTASPPKGEVVELWPHFPYREPHRAAVELFAHTHDPRPHITTRNIRKILDTHLLLGKPLPQSLARRLLDVPRHQTLEEWLDALPGRSGDAERGQRLVEELRQSIEAKPLALPRRRGAKVPASLTYGRTARRSWEVAYWKTIAALAEGRYLNKNNADCVRDPVTQQHLCYHGRDLDELGDYLLDYYCRVIKSAGMTSKALAGDLPFRWRTDFDFSWMGGWLNNQEGKGEERDLLVVIPGRDRKRAVIMADHYDTAYMADRYESHHGGKGPRLAASGADDNHSATATLMLGAPIFLALSKAGKLDCDIWLIHLTGEEFPADCLGARHLCQCLVEGSLRLRLAGGKERDLSDVRVQGVYVLDMVAHNNDRERDIFQISPGAGQTSMWLALQAHLANEIWNASAPVWNQAPERRGRGRGRRSPHGGAIPVVAGHLAVAGEVRPPYSSRSTLYNTDGQIFSDAGVPVVLFMENYDINRSGYHDTHDTMANIDLDYGAAVAAIALESVARAATEDPLA
jgi:hypothetical protein